MRNAPVISLLFFASLFTWWVAWGSNSNVEMRIAGKDKKPETVTVSTVSVFEQAEFIPGVGKAPALNGAWPRFRGENFDNIADSKEPIATTWPESGPAVLWRVKLGEGYAGPVIDGGRVYLLDYDQANKRDALLCLSLLDGTEIWRWSYPVKTKRFHGMSRTVPAIWGEYIVTLGPKCHVACLKKETGEFVWGIDLVKDEGTEVPEWYAGQCPLIDEGKVILAPSGKSLLMAVDIKTGKVLWRTPNPKLAKMTHASVIPMTFEDIKMYVYPSDRGVAGVSAQDGSILWFSSEWEYRIMVPSPVIIPGGRIFLTNGYNRGSIMFGLEKKDDKIEPEVLWKIDANTFGAEQHTPILYKEHLFGIRGGQASGELVCLDLEGEVVWESGRSNRFGLGAFMLIDDTLCVLNNTGTLYLVEANANGYRELAKAKVLEDHESWGPMAFADGRLLVRDLTGMACIDMRKESYAGK
ncbi:MAG: PQQ-binding-like beta-propeller repeat protein [Planctomycetes bacterium]|nr:PQQ-binding-like beta-propeller repeat protein [Planctomycetota bacterium]